MDDKINETTAILPESESPDPESVIAKDLYEITEDDAVSEVIAENETVAEADEEYEPETDTEPTEDLEAYAEDSVQPDGESADTPKKLSGSIPAAIMGGILGLVVALFLNAIACALTGGVRYFMFFTIPLCIAFGMILLKGRLGLTSLVINAVLSVVGGFIVPSFAPAAEEIAQSGVSMLSLPLVALTKVGETNMFSSFSINSASIYPILFLIIGVCVSWQFMRYFRSK